MGSSARSRRAGHGPCQSGQRCRRTAGRATAQWWSVISTWRSEWLTLSMTHPTWSGWPRSRYASSACVIDQLTLMMKTVSTISTAGWGAELLTDGRVYAGTTLYGGRLALRPAMTNWRTSKHDADFFVDVVRELGGRVAHQSP